MNYPLTPCGKFYIVPQTQYNIDNQDWCISCDLCDDPKDGTGCNKSDYDELDDVECMSSEPEQIFKRVNPIFIQKISLHDHVEKLYGNNTVG